jgi:hypothetical protein
MPESAIAIQREIERIRQEQEIFNHRLKKDKRSNNLKLFIGYTAILLLTGILIFSIYILVNNSEFPEKIVDKALYALFGDILGLIITVWRFSMKNNNADNLEPATRT